MKLIGKGYKLSTGKIITPNNGIIGLTEINGFEISEGYDGTYITEKEAAFQEDIELTNQELKEIALYMSQLWMNYANIL